MPARFGIENGVVAHPPHDRLGLSEVLINARGRRLHEDRREDWLWVISEVCSDFVDGLRLFFDEHQDRPPSRLRQRGQGCLTVHDPSLSRLALYKPKLV
jgi:hypothetical protein